MLNNDVVLVWIPSNGSAHSFDYCNAVRNVCGTTKHCTEPQKATQDHKGPPKRQHRAA